MQLGWKRLVGLLATAASLGGAAEGAEIRDLVPVVRPEGVLVGFRVAGAFSEEIERAIQTGLPVSFRYNVELKRERGIWLDARVARREIRTTVTYDNLTQRYSLTREIDGEIDRTEIVADAEAMRRFMTVFDALPMFPSSLLEPNESYYVRVNGVMKDRTLLLLIPWDVGTDWKEAHFTYLP